MKRDRTRHGIVLASSPMGDHDALFKRAFSVPAHAAGELRCVLPASIVEEMRHRQADLLFRAPLRDGPGHSYLYVLLEHQSEPDRLMPYRMLGYVQRIWDAIVRDEPGRMSLPPVIPVVVHHGEAGWSAPRSLHALVEGIASGSIPELSRFVPNFELCIDDLVSIDDEALRARPMAPLPKVTLWLLRDGRQLEVFLASLASWGAQLEALVRADRNEQDSQVIARYILRVAGELPFERLRDTLTKSAPAFEQAMASAAEQLIQQGLQRGLEQGRQEGRAEERKATLRDTLVRLLRARFGDLDADVEGRIAAATTDELDRWIERVVTAESARAIFDE
jgi:predicted transposase YdaD